MKNSNLEKIEVEIFPMSDMQQAYWIGRSDDLSSNAPPIHYYLEYDIENFNLSTFKEAWHKLLERHDMLRVVALEDGRQRIITDIPAYQISYEDITGFSKTKKELLLANVRGELSQYKADIFQWPQFKIKTFKINSHITRLAISLDMWCIDGRSLDIIFSELERLYNNINQPLNLITYRFQDYIAWVQAQGKSKEYQVSLAYWQERVKTFYDAPKLPIRSYTGKGNFIRIDHLFSKTETELFLKVASSLGVTINGLLLGVFAEVLKYWSEEAQFTLNIPRFNRPQIHPQINDVVGEFATFSLLSIDLSIYATFSERIIAIQRQLWQEMEYGQVSGIKILREMMHLSGTSKIGMMPIVFTSQVDNFSLDRLGKRIYGLTQTPQVWLDCQYYFTTDRLYINWDYIKERFPEALIEEMFSSYVSILHNLTQANFADYLNQENVLNLPSSQSEVRNNISNISKDYNHHSLFRQLVELLADNQELGLKKAIITERVELTYQELYENCICLGSYILSILNHKKNLKNEQAIIAILLPKGSQQIISVWGILASGSAYLPLDIEQPIGRLIEIIQDAKPAAIIVDSITKDLLREIKQTEIIVFNTGLIDKMKQYRTITQVTSLPGYNSREDELAYIIYTSGTTGKPKGVMIEHRGLLNALYHSKNSLFQFEKEPIVLGISSLHHDMSIFDTIGTIISKGTIVLPKQSQRKNPQIWFQLIEKYQINLWISVPAILEMMLIWLEAYKHTCRSLERVLLGGDWVSLAIINKFRKVAAKNLLIYSVGGPTETTLWNITNKIKEKEDEDWLSVPYGIPIPNCYYKILDNNLKDRPNWVVGEMYCGGVSLARGYLGDKKRTLEKFIIIPTGERLYRTGDLGRYHPDGRIEFVGRNDGQLKVKGNRIESGEVKLKLESWPEISKVVVYLYQDKLAVALLLAANQEKISQSELYARAERDLSSTMIPSIWLYLDEIPLTRNSKVDKEVLLKKTEEYLNVEKSSIKLDRKLNEFELTLGRLWYEILGHTPLSPYDNFFAMGGDSILLVRLLSKIYTKFKVNITLADLFTHLTLYEQSQLIKKNTKIFNNTEIDSLNLNSYPLSHSQEDMWMAEYLSTGQIKFKILLGFISKKILDFNLFRQALETIRKDSFPLSVLFSITAKGIEQFQDLKQDVPLFIEEKITKDVLSHKIQKIAEYHFKLTKEYAWRVYIIPLIEGGTALVFDFHHIIFDGWSVQIFLKKLKKYYQDNQVNLPNNKINYGDYAVWNRKQVLIHEKADSEFWKSELKDGEELTNSPCEMYINKIPDAEILELFINHILFQKIKLLSQSFNTSTFITMLCIYQITLASIFKKDNFYIETYDSGRENIQTHDLIGCFINNQIIHTKLNDHLSFFEHLKNVSIQRDQIAKHHLLPFSKIVKLIGKSGIKMGFNPISQASFVMQPIHDNKLILDEIEFENLNLYGKDIRLIYELSCWQSDNHMKLTLKFDSSRTTLDIARKIMASFKYVTEIVTTQPNIKIMNLLQKE